jgi:signal transduction histidine kinase
VTSCSRWWRGRFWVEIVLAVVVGVAAFVVATLVFLGPLRHLDGATALVLGLFLAMSVIIGAVATRAGRRAAGSERARSVLADEQAALRRVATLVARQPSPAEVFAAVTEEAGKLLHLDSSHLLAYQEDATVTVAGAWNLRGPPAPVGTRVPLDGDSVAIRVFRTQRPARIDDYTDIEGLAADYVRSVGVAAAVGAPIVVRGRLWGVMVVGSSRPQPLPADTEMRIGAFSELVATAIANTAARTELEQIVAEQAALGRVATLVTVAVPPRDVFTAVAAEVAGLFGVPLVGLFRYDGEGVATVIAGTGKISSYLGRRWPCPAGDPGLVTRVQRTGRPLRIDDYRQIRRDISESAREFGIGMAAGVPVLVSGRVWGAVMVAAGHERPPLPADTLDRLAAFTELMATAIANSDARTEIQRLAQEQAALRRVATLVARGADTQEVFAAVAREVSEVMHLPFAAIQRYEDDGETMTMIAAWSDRAHPFQPGTRWPYHGSGLAAGVRRTGRAGLVDDYSPRRGAFTAKAREVGLSIVAGAPIIVDGAVWGLMMIGSADGLLPGRTEDRLAEFTELLGTAVANTQSRTELSASRARIVAAADETRRRLERDLHDGIQQRLVSLALKAGTMATMTPQPVDKIQGDLSRLADGLGTAVDELREVSHGIHPAILSEAGLGPALEALARRSAVPVELHLNLGPRLGEHVEAAGYYIASEAITNVAKHAQATVIDLRADGCDGALILSVSDDGIGGADPSRGSGIIGLKDRVEALGGTISVLSPAGRGTALHVQLPAGPMAAPTQPGATS